MPGSSFSRAHEFCLSVWVACLSAFRLPGWAVWGGGPTDCHQRLRPERDGQQEGGTLCSQSVSAEQIHQTQPITEPLMGRGLRHRTQIQSICDLWTLGRSNFFSTLTLHGNGTLKSTLEVFIFYWTQFSPVSFSHIFKAVKTDLTVRNATSVYVLDHHNLMFQLSFLSVFWFLFSFMMWLLENSTCSASHVAVGINMYESAHLYTLISEIALV